MLILLEVEDIDRSQLMIGQYHLSNSLSFLRSLIILKVRMLKNVSILNHDVKAIIHYPSILLPIDEVSHLISIKWVGIAVLYDSGGPGIVEM